MTLTPRRFSFVYATSPPYEYLLSRADGFDSLLRLSFFAYKVLLFVLSSTKTHDVHQLLVRLAIYLTVMLSLDYKKTSAYY